MIRHLSYIPARGMALFPFIFVKYHNDLHDERLIRHEKIHIRQQAELLVIPFYFFYLINYLWNRLKGQTHMTAYLNICFEREAYNHDHEPDYLEKRKWGAYLKYL